LIIPYEIWRTNSKVVDEKSKDNLSISAVRVFMKKGVNIALIKPIFTPK